MNKDTQVHLFNLDDYIFPLMGPSLFIIFTIIQNVSGGVGGGDGKDQRSMHPFQINKRKIFVKIMLNFTFFKLCTGRVGGVPKKDNTLYAHKNVEQMADPQGNCIDFSNFLFFTLA